MDVKIEFVVKLLMFRSVVIITASVHGDKNVKLNHKEKVSLFRVILLMLHMIICTHYVLLFPISRIVNLSSIMGALNIF